MFSRLKINGLIFLALTLAGNQANAVSKPIDITIKAQINMNHGKTPTLTILNAEKFSPEDGCNLTSAPLVIMVNNQGEFVKIVDPSGFAAQEVQKNIEPNSLLTMPLGLNGEHPIWSQETGSMLMDGGALDILKGLGKFSTGTIIVVSILTGIAGKFLAIQTYNGTGWICKKIWTLAQEFYARKKLELAVARRAIAQ